MPTPLDAPGFPAPAWTASDLADPHGHSDKPEKVRRMFAAIARRYDLNNRLHSLWRDQAWRRFAVDEADVNPADTALDVACGTGDLTMALARAGARRVIGVDFTEEMLEVARHKLVRLPEPARARVEYLRADAQALPFDNASVDIVSIAFGIRNVADPARAIGEFRRILRPGGRLVILEFDTPRLAPVRWLNDLYCLHLMPITATLISGDRSGAYRYLPRSVRTFLTREQMCGLLRDRGFEHVRACPLTLGVCACYRGVAAPGAGGRRAGV